MGEVKQFRPRSLSPLDEMTQELNKERENVRTVVVLVRNKDNSIYVLGHGGDERGDDLLHLKRAFNNYIEEIFSDAMEPA